MPLYDYKCPTCNKVVELFLPVQKLDVPQKCRECRGVMERLISSSMHVKVGAVIDGRPRGQVIQEKNERLKKMHAGYSYEQESLRSKMEKEAQKRIQDKT